MNLLMEAMKSLGAVMLQIVAALLLEELTFGGLVRLFVSPWPGAGRGRKHKDSGNRHKGEGQCSH
jgi:hypothetical protein